MSTCTPHLLTVPHRCANCDGRGTITLGSWGDGSDWRDVTCDDCDGSGEVLVERDVEPNEVGDPIRVPDWLPDTCTVVLPEPEMFPAMDIPRLAPGGCSLPTSMKSIAEEVWELVGGAK